MSIWVLIIALVTPSGATVTSVEYTSRDTCMAAAQNFVAAAANGGWRVSWSCDKK